MPGRYPFLDPETAALVEAYEKAVLEAQEDAITDLLIASSQPGFEQAFAKLAVDKPPGVENGFRCTPTYMGEAVGPTREVRLG